VNILCFLLLWLRDGVKCCVDAVISEGRCSREVECVSLKVGFEFLLLLAQCWCLCCSQLLREDGVLNGFEFPEVSFRGF